MSNPDTAYDWPDVIPDFDVLKWKQANHARMWREIEGMTPEEVRERFHHASQLADHRRAVLQEEEE